ncbi:MAG: hypothetical protein Q4A79_01480 [Candidatus Saccharibacteria bacterium]|nr:hypothetical protein [Candidatus Saccharibacteria bacterium]
MRSTNASKKPATKILNNKVGKKKSLEKRSDKTKIWLVVGVAVCITIIVSIVVGILIINRPIDERPIDEVGPCICNGDENCKNICLDDVIFDLKPIIYLYPEEETEINVWLGKPEKLTSSYPKYVDGWDVVAYPNGDLIQPDGNKLYALYWEGQRDVSRLDLTTGFIVSREDSATFLEEKLAILGLNYKEREEFIVYWLPKLEASRYNYIYFATEEEIETEMPLTFSTQPDTIIRIRMIFRGLDEPREVEEQILAPAPERKGFTVVEWGGTELGA